METSQSSVRSLPRSYHSLIPYASLARSAALIRSLAPDLMNGKVVCVYEFTNSLYPICVGGAGKERAEDFEEDEGSILTTTVAVIELAEEEEEDEAAGGTTDGAEAAPAAADDADVAATPAMRSLVPESEESEEKERC